jgi:3-oxoacyl-[acyl-carrier protein] reductase
VVEYLKGKVALVTGASGGIGASIARKLAVAGASVAVHYKSGTDRAHAVVNEIRSNGGAAVAVAADLSDVAAIDALFAAVNERFGGVDIVVSNAGVAFGGKAIADTDEVDFDRVMTANAKSMFFVLRAAARSIRDNGRVIAIGSSTTEFPTANLGLYTASKAMAQSVTAVLARELGARQITVNTVVPGPTVPGLFEWAPDEFRLHAASLSPFNRLGTPDDIADVVAFLASEGGRWMTGQSLLANGGATI